MGSNRPGHCEILVFVTRGLVPQSVCEPTSMEGPSLALKADPVNSARAQFIGLVLNWGLYGLLISQTFTYYATFPHDASTNKAITYSVFSLETLQTTLLTYDIYCALVLHSGDAEFLDRVKMTWLTVPVLCGIVGWIATMFYANRIYKISRSRRVSGIIALLSFVQLTAAIIIGIRTLSAQSFSTLRQPGGYQLAPLIWTASTIMCDITITVVMAYHLVRLRREFHQPSPLIRKLMILTVETGMITALGSLSASIFFIVWPGSEMDHIPCFVLSKLYSHSLLRVLNSRNRTEYTGDVVTLPVSLEFLD